MADDEQHADLSHDGVVSPRDFSRPPAEAAAEQASCEDSPTEVIETPEMTSDDPALAVGSTPVSPPGPAKSGRVRRGHRWGRDAMAPTLASSLAEPESTAILRRQNRKLGWVAIIVGALILAIITGVFWTVRKNDSADKVVKNYLDAIAVGDAATALGYLAPADDSTYLTSAALANAKRIGDISVTKRSDTSVEAHYSIDSEAFTVIYQLERSHSRLRIINGTATLELPRQDQLGYSIGTEPGAAGKKIIVFPGGYAPRPTDARLTLTDSSVIKAGEPKTYTVTGALGLSEAGLASLRKATTEALKGCVAKKELSPSGCPWAFTAPPGQTIKSDSIVWTMAKDPSGSAEFSIDPRTLSAVSKPLEVVLTLDATMTKSDGTTYTYEEDNVVPTVADFDLTNPGGGLIWRSS